MQEPGSETDRTSVPDTHREATVLDISSTCAFTLALRPNRRLALMPKAVAVLP